MLRSVMVGEVTDLCAEAKAGFYWHPSLVGNDCSETSEEFSLQYEGNMNELGLTVMNLGAN